MCASFNGNHTGLASGIFLTRNLQGTCGFFSGDDLPTTTTTSTTTTPEPTGACCFGAGNGFAGTCLGIMGEEECVTFNGGVLYENTSCDDSPCGATTTTTTPMPASTLPRKPQLLIVFQQVATITTAPTQHKATTTPTQHKAIITIMVLPHHTQQAALQQLMPHFRIMDLKFLLKLLKINHY